MPASIQALMVVVVAIAGAGNTAAFAQPPIQPDTGTLRLTEREKDEVLQHSTESSVDATRSGLANSPAANRQVHGIMGVEAGSHGSRFAFGAATIPLSDHAQAAVSFRDSRYGGYRRR